MRLKKTISFVLLFVITAFAFTACSSSEIEITIKPFPAINGTDMEGNEITNDIFSNYDVTIVNFWSNGCGTCIEEMPDLEGYYKDFKDKNINLIGVGCDAGESKEKLETAKNILEGKGVTYTNIVPDIEGEFYKEFIHSLTGYPITYIVDNEGNIIGAPIYGVVKNQEEKLLNRIEDTKQ